MNNNYIKKFCSSQNFEFLEILSTSDRKDTVIFTVRQNNNPKQKLVVKLCGPKTPTIIRSSVNKEIQFYENNSSHYISKLIISGKDFFVIEYNEGISLYEYFKKSFSENDPTKLTDLLIETSSMLNSFHSFGNGRFEGEKTKTKFVVDILFDRIGNLISSGPKGTIKNNFEVFLLRQIFKLFSSKLKKTLLTIVESWLLTNAQFMSTYGHDDLHCNNVLVDNEKNLKLIDFENLRSPGVWISDVLYFYATIYALFSSKSKIQGVIKQHASNYIRNQNSHLNSSIDRILDLFCKAADTNSRFRLYNKGIKITKILSFVNSLNQ